MKIVVADQHAIVRRGLRFIVAASRPGWTVTEVASPAELFDALRLAPPDVLVLDLNLGARSGIDVLSRVRSEFPRIPVLILSGHTDAEHAVRSLRAGASGYLRKDSDPDEILGAIEKVGGGGRYVTGDVVEAMAEELARGTTERPHERLSTRELEVFRQIAQGRSVSEIAQGLHLSVKTVSTYRRRILDKTGFRTNADIIGYAIRHGVV